MSVSVGRVYAETYAPELVIIVECVDVLCFALKLQRLVVDEVGNLDL